MRRTIIGALIGLMTLVSWSAAQTNVRLAQVVHSGDVAAALELLKKGASGHAVEADEQPEDVRPHEEARRGADRQAAKRRDDGSDRDVDDRGHDAEDTRAPVDVVRHVEEERLTERARRIVRDLLRAAEEEVDAERARQDPDDPAEATFETSAAPSASIR